MGKGGEPRAGTIHWLYLSKPKLDRLSQEAEPMAGDTSGSCCGFSSRPEQEQKVWVPAKCPSCPSSFTAVSPKQRAPSTVHRTWLGLLHAARARAGVGRQGPVRAGRAQKPRAGEEPRQRRRGLWHREEKAPQGQGLTLDSKLEPSF